MSAQGAPRSSRESWYIGCALAIAHLLIVAAFLLSAARGSRDAQWQLIFLPVLLLDLPAALVAYPLGFAAMRASEAIGVGVDSMLVFVAIANGLFGTLFYFIAPPAISAYRRLKRAPV